MECGVQVCQPRLSWKARVLGQNLGLQLILTAVLAAGGAEVTLTIRSLSLRRCTEVLGARRSDAEEAIPMDFAELEVVGIAFLEGDPALDPFGCDFFAFCIEVMIVWAP